MAVTIDPGADRALEELVADQRDRLLEKLRLQRVHAAGLWAWYHGEQDYPVVPGRYREAYRLLVDLSRTPWARLVVDTIAERLHVSGFRSGAAASDVEAWRLFQGSRMNADERLVYTEALVTGVGYLSVSDDGRMAPESVFEVTHEAAPGDARSVAAAIKVYPLDWRLQEWALELYRPDAVYRWTAVLPEPLEPGAFLLDESVRRPTDPADLWSAGDPFVSVNPLGVVPIVPFENRATILGGGVSELEDCIPVLRRIDKLTLDLLLTSDVSAFKQRWATGMEVPKDPDTGKPVEPFKAAVDRVWMSENPEARFGAFEASDLGQYLRAIESCVATLCAITRVPAHYLMQSNLANPPTAESLVSSESGLVAKVRERQRRYGEAWETATELSMRLAGGALGVTPERLEIIWTDAEMRNPAQVADAATKLMTVGVPQRALWEYVGATPQQIAEWTLEAAASELVAMAAPVANAAPAGPPA